MKRAPETTLEPCAECGADPEDDHASWCEASEDDDIFSDPLSRPPT